MTPTQKANDAKLPKRLSPELAEVLHMLKALETQTGLQVPTTALR